MKIVKYILFIFMLIISLLSGCTSGKPVSEDSKIVQSKIESKIIEGDLDITVYLPKGYNIGVKYPVLYALHGASGNEWVWFDNLNANSCADKLINQNKIKPLIIVCTKTLNSMSLTYSNRQKSKYVGKDLYEEYVCQELVPYIDSHYKTIKSNKSRYIGGISMGGFIALQIGLHHPQLFGKVGGHSPASWIYDYSDISFDHWLYPGEIVKSNTDPIKFANEKGLSTLKVFLDCGESDFGIVDDTKKIYAALLKRGIDTTCSITKGDHTPEYWKGNMEKYLEFYNN